MFVVDFCFPFCLSLEGCESLRTLLNMFQLGFGSVMLDGLNVGQHLLLIVGGLGLG